MSKTRRKKRSKLEPFKEIIKGYLKKGEEQNVFITAVFMYKKIKAEGYTGSVSLLRKHLRKEKQQLISILKPVIQSLPGEQAQVDWGEKYLETEWGARKKVYIFCITLSYSRVRFIRFYPKANRYYFLLGHKEAFAYFGGVPPRAHTEAPPGA